MKSFLKRCIPVLGLLALGGGLCLAQVQPDPKKPPTQQEQPAHTPGGAQTHEYKTATIKGRTLSYALVLPRDFDQAKTYPVLLALPPGDQSQGMVEMGLSQYWEAEAVARGWVVVSPIAPNRTMFHDGSEDLVPELLDSIQRGVKVEGGRFHLAGISNGGLSAFRIAVENPRRFLSLLALPGYTPEKKDENDLGRIKGINVTMWVGEKDPQWVREMQKIQAKMERLGIKSVLNVLPGQGHVVAVTPKELFDTLDAVRPGYKPPAQPAVTDPAPADPAKKDAGGTDPKDAPKEKDKDDH